MAFPKKTVLLLLLAIVIVAVAFRYPLVEHERYQTDSYFIHLLGQSIVDEGYAKWTYHTLSYFGYFPLSYPSGVPFLLAESSTMTGLTVEVTILVMNMIVTVLFVLVVFVLSREFIERPEYVILVLILAALSTRFIDTTYWNASSRGFMTVLALLIVFVLFRAVTTRKLLMIPAAVLLTLGCLFIHHMAVLLLLIAVGYLLAAFPALFLIRRVASKKRVLKAAYIAAVTASVVVVGFGLFSFFGESALASFSANPVIDVDSEALELLTTIGATYTIQVGLVLLVALLGIPYLFIDPNLSTRRMFPLAVVIVFIPLIGSGLYISLLIAPFIAILGVRVISLAGSKAGTMGRRALLILIPALIIGSSIFAAWNLQRWNGAEYVSGDPVIVDDQVFNDANYLTANCGGLPAISNVNVLSLRLDAFSDADFLGPDILLAINGDVTAEELRSEISWSKAQFPVNLYLWYGFENEPEVDNWLLSIMISGAKDADYEPERYDYFSAHQKLVVGIDQDWPNSVVTAYSSLSSKFAVEVRDAVYETDDRQILPLESYIFYSSDQTSFYLVELPL